jgi:hypothetical protein
LKIVEDPQHLDAAPAPGENFDAAKAPAAPYFTASRLFLNKKKSKYGVRALFSNIF